MTIYSTLPRSSQNISLSDPCTRYAMKPPSDSYTAQKSRACDVKYRKVIGNHMLLRTNLAEIWHGVVKDALPPALKTLSDTALVARLTGYIDAAYTRADHLGTTDGFLKNGKHYETCKNDAGETIFWKTIGDEDTPSITLKTLLDKVIKEGIDALSDNPFSVIEITDAGVKNYLPVGSRAKFASVQKDAKKLILDLGRSSRGGFCTIFLGKAQSKHSSFFNLSQADRTTTGTPSTAPLPPNSTPSRPNGATPPPNT